MKIPNKFYFYWSGAHNFYFAYTFSIKSILKIENPEKIVIYYNNPLPDTNKWKYLQRMPVEFREFNIDDFRFDFLSDFFYDNFKNFINQPQNPHITYNVSDIFRCLVLYKYGGIYSDFDTLTIKSIKETIKYCDAFIPTSSTRSVTVDNESSNFLNGNLGSCVKSNFYKNVLQECDTILTNLVSLSTYHNIAFGTQAIHRAHKKCNNVKAINWKIFHSIGHKKRASGKNGFYYKDVYQKICNIPNEACVLHFHTSKTQSASSMHAYKQPDDVLRNRKNCTFAEKCAPFIDEDMKKYDWEF